VLEGGDGARHCGCVRFGPAGEEVLEDVQAEGSTAVLAFGGQGGSQSEVVGAMRLAGVGRCCGDGVRLWNGRCSHDGFPALRPSVASRLTPKYSAIEVFSEADPVVLRPRSHGVVSCVAGEVGGLLVGPEALDGVLGVKIFEHINDVSGPPDERRAKPAERFVKFVEAFIEEVDVARVGCCLGDHVRFVHVERYDRTPCRCVQERLVISCAEVSFEPDHLDRRYWCCHGGGVPVIETAESAA